MDRNLQPHRRRKTEQREDYAMTAYERLIPNHRPFSRQPGTAASGELQFLHAFGCNNDREEKLTVEEEKECSMCGDVGIPEDLFRCKRCLSRYQHTYCSRLYPNLGPEMCVCNWCLHEERKEAEISNEYCEGTAKQKGTSTTSTSSYGPKNTFDFLLQIAEVLPEAASGGDGKAGSESESNGVNWAISEESRMRDTPKGERNRDKKKQVQIGLNKSSSSNSRPRGIVRRYKLLADVLC